MKATRPRGSRPRRATAVEIRSAFKELGIIITGEWGSLREAARMVSGHLGSDPEETYSQLRNIRKIYRQ